MLEDCNSLLDLFSHINAQDVPSRINFVWTTVDWKSKQQSIMYVTTELLYLSSVLM